MDDEKFDLNSRIWVWFNSVLSYDNIIAHDFLNEIDGCATFADVIIGLADRCPLSDFLGDTLIGSSSLLSKIADLCDVDLDTALGLWEYASGEDIDQFDKEGILHMIDAAKKAEGIEPYVSQAGPNGGVDDGEDLRAGGPVSEGDPWRDGMVAQVAGLMEQVVDLDAKAAAGADTVLAELFEPLANNSTDAAIELFGVYSRSDASGRSAIAEVFHALTGETFESAFQAGRAFGIAAGAVRTSASTGVERNGLHFYYGDEPKPGPEFFRERHSKTRPIVCLETGETFDGNPAAARPLHVSPAAISQAVRYGTPVAGLHFYHGDEPKPAPEFFKPIKPERGKSPMQMAAAARAAAGNPGRPDGGQRPRRAV